MTWDQRKHLDLDHETDALGRRTGRYNGLAHRVCNRKDGGTVAYARREARVAAGRSPAERADHDHHVAVRMRREAKLARAAMEQEKVGRPW